MYNIEFLPIAKEDIDNIIRYVHQNLKNPTASKKLKILFSKSLDYICEFPYGNSIYESTNSLKYEYRSYRVKNFLMFYIINENKKLITIVRVLYQKMNIKEILLFI